MEKRYNHQESEQSAQKLWQKNNTYAVENNPGPLFSIDTPPPTISGSLHIGHIFSYTQTDIIARYKRMNGYSVFYPFGFDDNGLPTERYVEKKRKVKGHQIGRSEFIKICLEESKIASQEFQQLWQKMGISADWSNVYSTISDEVRALSQASFIELFKKGYIYRKNEPALYCTNCRTSVAQAELDDKELLSFFNDIVFKDAQGNDLIIGTTRPELLSSCVALLFNPNDERYQHLKGTKAIVPLFDFEIPVLEDEQVEIEKGTGLVMCCTFGDKTDIQWFKKFNLPYKQSIGLDGKWQEHTGFLAGLKTRDARVKIIEELIKHDLLLRQKEITHPVNVHERCGKEIEFVMLQQWFINILEHKKLFLQKADLINWYPSFMKSRYINWVENLGWDWCISRQRFYGVPFPAWHCQDCDTILLADKKDLPIDPQETTFNGSCKKCNGTNIIPDTDVMDTWNTSSLTPYICANLYYGNIGIPTFSDEAFVPMSMRPQAHDIIRTWAFYTIVKTTMHQDTIAWKDIVISGHVLSGQKEKISKSKGGVAQTPATLLQHYPADAIRYWTASGSLGHDIAFSEGQLKIGLRLITKVWNAFRFIREHIENVEMQKLPDDFGTINEWLLHTASERFTEYKTYLERNEFGIALTHAEQFFWHNFCDNYLELIKNQLFNPDDYTQQEVYATRWTLYHVGLRILQLYAPYMPHITETIYQLIYEKETKNSIHHTKFDDTQSAYIFEESKKLAQQLIGVIAHVRKLKTEQQLSLKVPLKSLTIYMQDDILREQLQKHEQLLRGVTHSEKLAYKTKTKDSSELKSVDGLWHAHVVL